MTISLSKDDVLALSLFGFAVIPVSRYQELVSGNETKGDHIQHLESTVKTNTDKIDGMRLYIQELEREKADNVNLMEDLNRRIQNRDEQIEMIQGHLESEQKSAKDAIRELECNSDRQKITIQQLLGQVKSLEESDRANDEIIDDLNAHLFDVRQKLQSTQQELNEIKETYTKTLATNAELDQKLSGAIANLSKSEQLYNEQTVQIRLERTANRIAIDNVRRDILIALDNLEIKQAS